mgnify:CR=1 FL=1
MSTTRIVNYINTKTSLNDKRYYMSLLYFAKYYLKELNENYYLSDNFYFMSVFSYLSNNKISWINKQKNINKKKFDLFVNFMTQVINEENKLNLF